MHYLLWHDDTRKPTPIKIAEAMLAYRARFGVDPNVVLVNQADLCDLPGVRVEGYVRRNNFWVGREEG